MISKVSKLLQLDIEKELEEGHRAAVAMVAHVRRMRAADLEQTVVDESGEWTVIVKRKEISRMEN